MNQIVTDLADDDVVEVPVRLQMFQLLQHQLKFMEVLRIPVIECVRTMSC